MHKLLTLSKLKLLVHINIFQISSFPNSNKDRHHLSFIGCEKKISSKSLKNDNLSLLTFKTRDDYETKTTIKKMGVYLKISVSFLHNIFLVSSTILRPKIADNSLQELQSVIHIHWVENIKCKINLHYSSQSFWQGHVMANNFVTNS